MQGLIILFAYQCLGQFIQDSLFTMLPGPLIGMLLLFISMSVFPQLYFKLIATTKVIFKHIMLIYIVYGVGLMNYADVIINNGRGIVAIISLASILTITLTGLIANRIKQ